MSTKKAPPPKTATSLSSSLSKPLRRGALVAVPLFAGALLVTSCSNNAKPVPNGCSVCSACMVKGQPDVIYTTRDTTVEPGWTYDTSNLTLIFNSSSRVTSSLTRDSMSARSDWTKWHIATPPTSSFVVASASLNVTRTNPRSTAPETFTATPTWCSFDAW